MSEAEKPESLIQVLSGIADLQSVPPGTTASEMTERLRRALLLSTSDSDDNRACAAAIDIGSVNETWGAITTGIRIHELRQLVSGILWRAEGCSIPAELQRDIPGITQQHWDACLRLATILLTMFEGSSTPEE